MPEKGTTVAVIILRQQREEHHAKRKKLYMCCMDLEKDFYRVPRSVRMGNEEERNTSCLG